MRPDEKIALKLALKFAIPVAVLFALSGAYAVLFSFFGDDLFRNPWTKAFVAILYPLGMLSALSTPIGYLKKKHAYEVDMMFYFLCLAFSISLIVTVAAVEFGAIDNSGNYVGERGEWFKSGLSFFMSIKDTLYLSITIVSVTIAPQIMSYILSGLFGCASRIVYAEEIIEISFWLAVKPLITVSGISMGLSLAAYLLAIEGFSIEHIYSMIAMSSVMLYFSFGIVCVYKMIKDFMQGEDSRIPQRCKDWIMSVHKKATLYNKPKNENDISGIISSYFFGLFTKCMNKWMIEFLRNNRFQLNRAETDADT